jgi:hypothetical protein
MLEEQRDKQTATEAALQKLQQELDDKAGKISLAEENLRAKGVSLGVSPIPVSKQPVSISGALPVLDSAADRLRRLDQILGTRLEAEGSKLCRAVIEYILTCFRSHDPAISLGPVIAGPVVDTEDAARGGVCRTL